MSNKICFISVLIVLILSSCSSVKYYSLDSDDNGYRFSNGRWLVNYVDADVSDETKQSIKDALVYGISNIKGCRAMSLDQAKWLDTTKIKSSYMLSEEDRKSSELRNNFDYVINVRVDFSGQRYSKYNLHTTTCSHTCTCNNRTYTHTTEKQEYLEDKQMDINTVIEVVAFDLSTGKQCYTHGIESDYSFIPVHMTTCDHETLTASIVVGIFDAFTSTPPSSSGKIEHLLVKSSRKILRNLKKQYRKSRK